ncbi:MAG TPA: penicillin-binding transpeptidase domain-containing protein [Anaerolineaceae bacterium]|nr:penicillin-binding transpeptidase domain-containing protein [Anaerolineaceae bacterium]
MKLFQSQGNPIPTWRLVVIFGVIALVFSFYAFRLFGLQIIEGGRYQEYALENRHVTVMDPTTRGIIYDRNNIVLARNVASYNVMITPAYLPNDPGAVQNIYRELAALINVPSVGPEPSQDQVKNFTPCISEQLAISQIVFIQDTNSPYDPVRIKCNIDQKTALTIRERQIDLPGVSVEIEPIREYPTGGLSTEVIGFLGPVPAGAENQYPGLVPNRDKVGYAGIEQYLQDILGGQNGRREIEVDVAGQELGNLDVPIAPVPGNNVRLTIDTRLQNAAKAALKGELDYLHAESPNIKESNGVVIAMDPRSGEILALVSWPTYENNRMARIIPSYYYEQLTRDPNRPLFNHAISAEIAPGSVFKLSASLGILNEGVVTPEKTVDDPGKIFLTEKYYENDPGKPRPYYCWAWRTGGHGKNVDFLTGFSQSCDVYFYKVGGGYPGQVENGGLGIWRLGEYAKALGYSLYSGIQLPGEQDGLIPDPDWKRLTIGENWSTGDTYISTIGQGYVLATPIQVLRSIQTVAMDGKMMRPTLVKEILDQEGHVIKPFEPQMVCDITKQCKLRCDTSTDKCTIDTLNLCDLQTSQCKKGTFDDTIDTSHYPFYGNVIQPLDDNGDPILQNNVPVTKPISPWVVQLVKEGMRKVVVDGTAAKEFEGMEINTAGKTGTAEYCDDLARTQNLCQPGNWPAHAWYAGYAPYDNPEIAIVAFVYHGTEGSVVAAPVVRKVMEAYFELKSIDKGSGGAGQ